MLSCPTSHATFGLHRIVTGNMRPKRVFGGWRGYLFEAGIYNGFAGGIMRCIGLRFEIPYHYIIYSICLQCAILLYACVLIDELPHNICYHLCSHRVYGHLNVLMMEAKEKHKNPAELGYS